MILCLSSKKRTPRRSNTGEASNGALAATSSSKISKSAAATMLILLLGAGASIAAKEPRSLTVVELFTSQGCSSCPPANANAIDLSDRRDVLVLSFGVTYWNYLGWKDSFAKAEFTQRQEDYEPNLGRSGPFTPQIVVNGRRDTVGNVREDIDRLIVSSTRTDAAEIEIKDRIVEIGDGRAPSGGADVWLVRYDPRLVEVPVRRGENSGRTLPHKNVVRTLERLGVWDGRRATFALPPSHPELRTAILLQIPGGGPILAAAAM